ncbi:MAG: hypothetical protein ACPG71_08655 [Candidatus Puniceispirillaceae bacterium]
MPVLLAIVLGLAMPAMAQNTSQRSGLTSADRELLTRQQLRLDTFEESLKELRGIVEEDVRNSKTQLEKLSASVLAKSSGASANSQAVQAEIVKLNDSIAIMNQRLSRIFEMTSDIEFRVLRVEKRVSTLLSLSDGDIANELVQQDTLGAGTPPQVSMSKDESTGQTSWSIDKSELEPFLETDNASDNGTAISQAGTAIDNGTADVSANATDLPTVAVADTEVTEQPEPATPKILPDDSPEQQYRFALSRALQNDLEMAEAAFSEFRDFHVEHERSSDALFWLGRVQFMRGKYEDSAITFFEFNTEYQDDPRRVETSLWIAESVAQFASPEQACDVYKTLVELLDQPPETFTKRLKELSDAANCPAPQE